MGLAPRIGASRVHHDDAADHRGMKELLQHQVSARARALPDSTALVWKDVRMTYGELEETSNRLASLLVDAGCEPGERVALLMPQHPLAVVGMLGALKAGAVFVPLDPIDPPPRLARALAAADCRWILAGGRAAHVLPDVLGEARLAREPLIGWLDQEPAAASMPQPVFELPDLAAFPPQQPVLRKAPELAQILFASGSTGLMRGVMLTHSGIAQFLRWANTCFGIGGTDRISQHAPLRFASSTFDVLGALWAGAELHLVPPELNIVPHRLAALIRESALTQWFAMPAMLSLMAKSDAVRQDDFPSLRRVLFAGELLPTSTLVYLMRRLPHVRFTQLYGPAETTIASCHHTIGECPHSLLYSIPLGTACDGEELVLLDEQLQPVPDGEAGDLYIGGAGVSPGYWGDPRRTRAAFIDDPRGAGRLYRTGDRARRDASGLFHHCGRATPRGTRGLRIEPAIIEAALQALPVA
jgi:amino acid adenylation domain-containing protein